MKARQLLSAILLTVATLPLAGQPIAPNSGAWSWTTGAYLYDGSGNITAIGTHSFVYDLQGRLVTANIDRPDMPGVEQQTYVYDAFGNMTSRTTSGGITSMPTTASTNHLSGLNAVYDAAGNLIQFQPLGQPIIYQYRFDAVNAMQEVKAFNVAGEPTQVHIYTADDERLWTYDLLTNVSSWKIRDLGSHVLRDYAVAGNAWSLSRDYVYRYGQPLAAVTPTQTLHFSLDHLGTPRVITDGARVKLGVHHYFPFGQEWTTVSGSQEGERLKFTGHERDANPSTVGSTEVLDYMHARYYAASVGRFLSPDPIPGESTNPQSWNLYTYVRNNPLRYTDPSGLTLYAKTSEAQHDVCAMIGPTCSQFVKFDADGKASVTATAAELKANEALQLVYDLVNSQNVYGAWVGTQMPSGSKTLYFGEKMSQERVVNLSTTARTDVPARLNLPLPAGFDGAIGVFSGYPNISVGADGRPVSRFLVVFHELAENYHRTEKMKQYAESHQNAIQRESILRSQQPHLNQFGFGSGPNKTTVKP